MKAVELSRECHRQPIEIRALRALALSRAHLEGPDADGIEELLDAADALIERTHAHALAPRIPEARAELEARLQEAGRDLLALGTRLRAEGLSVEELEAIRRLGDTLRGGLGGGNAELVEQEYLAMLDLVEQLELQLVADEIGAEESAVRTQTPAEIAAEYEEAVAEYFRQLSRSEQP